MSGKAKALSVHCTLYGPGPPYGLTNVGLMLIFQPVRLDRLQKGNLEIFNPSVSDLLTFPG